MKHQNQNVYQIFFSAARGPLSDKQLHLQHFVRRARIFLALLLSSKRANNRAKSMLAVLFFAPIQPNDIL